MQIIEQYSKGKHPDIPNEDQITALSSGGEEGLLMAAVIDGATPKTSFRFPDGETPGHFAARTIAEALLMISREKLLSDAADTIRFISRWLDCQTNQQMHDSPFFSTPTASVVILDCTGKKVIQVGDCPFAFVMNDGSVIEHRNEKRIDHVLADWRSSINKSYLSRGIMTLDEIASNDPGRAIIQPFITQQVRWQNADPSVPYSFGVIDGSDVPTEFIKIHFVPEEASEIILASDGLPRLFGTLSESLKHLHEASSSDPLCISILRGTKGLRQGAEFPDDVSYMRIKV